MVTDQTDESASGDVQTDDKFRNAVVAYEKAQGRFPICKDSLQKGYDIDSFSDSPGTPGRQLIRRIEVKGRTHAWDGDEIVELSRAQYEEALEPLGDEKMDIDPEFDHWVYVVEELEEGRFNVLPTKNPARTAQKFELRGGTWRNFVEEEAEVKSEQVCFEPDDNVPKRRSIRDLPREPQEEMEEMQEKEDK